MPGAGNPQAFNRYSYVLNSPLNFRDPSGHVPLIEGVGTVSGITNMNNLKKTQSLLNSKPMLAASEAPRIQQSSNSGMNGAAHQPTSLVPLPSSNPNASSGNITWQEASEKLSQSIKMIQSRAKQSGLTTAQEFVGEALFIVGAQWWNETAFVQTPVGYHDVFFTSNYTLNERLTAALEVYKDTAVPLAGAASFGVFAPSQMFSHGTTVDVMGSPLRSNPIIITGKGLGHVVDHHTISGSQSAGQSLFNDGVDIVELINQAQATNPIVQPKWGNLEYVVDAGQAIGTDKFAGYGSTSFYTVITHPNGDLVTAFPGLPKYYYGVP